MLRIFTFWSNKLLMNSMEHQENSNNEANNDYKLDFKRSMSEFELLPIFIRDSTDIIEKTNIGTVKNEIDHFITRSLYTRQIMYYYKNFRCGINFNGIVFCGHVLEFDNNLRRYFTKHEMMNLTQLLNIYIAHGGFKYGNGFNCCNCDDDVLIIFENSKNDGRIINNENDNIYASFKSEQFVKSELSKVIDSIIVIAQKRGFVY